MINVGLELLSASAAPLRDQLLLMSIPRVARLFLIALGAYALVAVFALIAAERLIFQPPPPSYASGAFPMSHIPLGSGDSLAVLYLPNPAARYTILYSHGNAEDLGHTLPLLQALRHLGFGVISYDYRGYGASATGPPTTRKAIQDAEAVYQYAVGYLKLSPERLILYGTSVGSGPALALAAVHQPAGLILQSAFTSTFRVITRVPLLPFDRFPNLIHLRDVRCPVLIIHGTRDFVVPWSHGKRLFSEAAGPKQALWVEGAGHNDVVQVGGQGYADALAKFVDLLEEGGTAR